jgi:hypothetical protein
MAGALCCKTEGPLGGTPPTCFVPTASQPTCSPGCAPLCVSDRNLKRDIEPVDERLVLEQVASMPVTAVLDPIDAHGASFAAIKALYRELEEQRARLDQLEDESRSRCANPRQ